MGEHGLFSMGQITMNTTQPEASLYLDLDIDYDTYRDCEGRLVFMIVWPSLADDTKDERLVQNFMVWSQMSTPLQPIRGYEPLSVPYPGPNDKAFGGVSCSKSRTCAILDGNTAVWNWHYAM